jgi:dihydropteroate synthase
MANHKDCCLLRLKLNARVIAATTLAPILDELGHAVSAECLPMADALTLAVELPAAGSVADALVRRMSSAGGEAVAGGGEVVLTGPRRTWGALLQDLASASADLRAIAAELRTTLDAYDRRSFEIPMGPHRLTVGPQPVLMGILNITPDSFSDGGRFLAPKDAVARAEKLVADGAALLDIGGESTRPGSEPVSEDEEWARVGPVLRELAARTDVPLSIDTRRSGVARRAVNAGACLINDVTGLSGDPDMARAVADSGAGLVLMHMQGEPRSMQDRPHYDHLMADICRHLRRGIERAVDAGVPEDRILIDPGIGFGKTLDHNLEILANLGQLRSLGRPILLGVSRKRFIGDLTGVRTPADRICGTAAACAMAVAAGALVLRVHDVREVREAAAVAFAISRQNAVIPRRGQNTVIPSEGQRTVIPSERSESRNLAVRITATPFSRRGPSTSLGVTTTREAPETSDADGGTP